MKIDQLKSVVEEAVVERQQFDDETKTKLHGKTVREAFRLGILTDVGDEVGGLIFKHNTYDDLYISLNLNYIVKLSAGLKEVAVDYKIRQFMNCVFTFGISTIPGAGLGKPFFNLGKARVLDLNPTAVNSISLVEA